MIRQFDTNYGGHLTKAQANLLILQANHEDQTVVRMVEQVEAVAVKQKNRLVFDKELMSYLITEE